MALVVVCEPENRIANIIRMLPGPACWLSKEHLPIMTLRPVVRVTRWFRFGLIIFHGQYNMTPQDQGVDYPLCSCHRCDLVILKERGHLSIPFTHKHTVIYRKLLKYFDKLKQDFFQARTVSTLLYGCTIWKLTKHIKKKLDGNYTRMLRAILNKSWKQHPMKQSL